MQRRYSQATIADEQDRAAELPVQATERGTEGAANCPTDTAPEDLGDEDRAGRQGDVEDAEARSSGLCDDDILRLEELADARPQPVVRDDLVVLLRQVDLEFGHHEL